MDIISSLKFSTVFTLILAAALTLGSVDEIKAQTSAIEPTVTQVSGEISVGLENQTPFKTTFDHNNQLPLVIVSRPIGLLALGLVLGVVSIAIFLMVRTNLIRQPGPKPSEGKSPYDLSGEISPQAFEEPRRLFFHSFQFSVRHLPLQFIPNRKSSFHVGLSQECYCLFFS
jgi:hypothetical protein